MSSLLEVTHQGELWIYKGLSKKQLQFIKKKHKDYSVVLINNTNGRLKTVKLIEIEL